MTFPEPQIITRPAMTLAGLAINAHYKAGEFPKLWDRFVPRMNELPAVDRSAYGACRNYNKETDHLDYIAAMQITPGATIPSDMETWQIPAQTYAAFPCTLATISPTYQHIHFKWLIENPHYKEAPTPVLEFYDENFRGGDSILYIWLPIQPKLILPVSPQSSRERSEPIRGLTMASKQRVSEPRPSPLPLQVSKEPPHPPSG